MPLRKWTISKTVAIFLKIYLSIWERKGGQQVGEEMEEDRERATWKYQVFGDNI